MAHISEEDHIKEVYARFGLALYMSQVLEHGIVNALVVLDLIPNRRHTVRSKSEWEMLVDDFMEGRFKKTMGTLIKSLKAIRHIPPELENEMREALHQRNWLAHGFFRDRSTDFGSYTGREKMLTEVDAARDLFSRIDDALEEIMNPLWHKAGITQEIFDQAYQKILEEFHAPR